MNLYLFPAPADNNGGYNIAVNDAYKRLPIKEDDVIVWAALSKPKCAREVDFVVYYRPFNPTLTL